MFVVQIDQAIYVVQNIPCMWYKNQRKFGGTNRQ